jgi:hypothetical protein
MARLVILALVALTLGGCDDAKTSLVAQCRNEAVKALPAEVNKAFSQPIDSFVRDCATAKGLRLEGWHAGCPTDTADPELIDACYRWTWETPTPHN